MYDGFVTIAWRNPIFADAPDKALQLLPRVNKKGVHLCMADAPMGVARYVSR